MPSASLRNKHERFESLFRRFKKSVERADVIKELRAREFYEKPSAKRKREKAAAKKRAQRAAQERQLVQKRLY